MWKACLEFQDSNPWCNLSNINMTAVRRTLLCLFICFSQGNPVDLSPFAGEPDIHVVTSLLKLYLRELTDPLLTFELYDGFIAAEG